MKTTIIALALLGFSTLAVAQEWQLVCAQKGNCYVLHQSGKLYHLVLGNVTRLYLEEADIEKIMAELKDPKNRAQLLEIQKMMWETIAEKLKDPKNREEFRRLLDQIDKEIGKKKK